MYNRTVNGTCIYCRTLICPLPFESVHYRRQSNKIKPKLYRREYLCHHDGSTRTMREEAPGLSLRAEWVIGMSHSRIREGMSHRVVVGCTWCGWWIFISTKIDNDPGYVTKKSNWNIRVDKLEKRFHNIHWNHIISNQTYKVNCKGQRKGQGCHVSFTWVLVHHR